MTMTKPDHTLGINFSDVIQPHQQFSAADWPDDPAIHDLCVLAQLGFFSSWSAPKFRQMQRLLNDWLSLEQPESVTSTFFDSIAPELSFVLECQQRAALPRLFAEIQRPFDLDLRGWLERALELLQRHWGDLPAFSVEHRVGVTGRWAAEGQISVDGVDFRLNAALLSVPGPAMEAAATLVTEHEWSTWSPSLWSEEDARTFFQGQYCLIFLKVHLNGQQPSISREEFMAWMTCLNRGLLPVDEIGVGADGVEQRRRLTPLECLRYWERDVHHQIRQRIDDGASDSEIQHFINQTGGQSYGLVQYANRYQQERSRHEEISAAVEEMFLWGRPPQIALADLFPSSWQPKFRVLREGLKFTDQAIALVIVTTVVAMLNPQAEVSGWSMRETPLLWLFLIGPSGTAKSVLLKTLVSKPLADSLDYLAELDRRDHEQQQQQLLEEPDYRIQARRPRNLLYTSPSTQGIRADLAQHGAQIPGLLLRDELNGWLEQMANPMSSAGDTEFWLSSYDAHGYHNDVFADASKSRQVRHGKISVIGGIQPAVFTAQLSRGNANGFNSRPLFVHLPRSKRVLVNADQATEQLNQDLARLYLAALQSPWTNYQLDAEAAALFQRLYDELEERSIQAASDDVEALWAKAPGQVLRAAAGIQFLLNHLSSPEACSKSAVDEGVATDGSVCSIGSRALQLAAHVVIAGKVVGAQLQERAANPALAMAEVVLAYVRKRQGSGQRGVSLGAIRKGAFASAKRPAMADLQLLVRSLSSRGLVQLLEGGNAIRAL